MSIENYTVAVKLSLVENVSKGLLGMAGHFAVLNKQADLFNAKMRALKSQVAIGGMMVGAGVALAAPFIFATLQASKLQQQLLFVQEKTKANVIEMKNFRAAIEDIGNITGFTSIQIATGAKTLATGLNVNISQLKDVLPLYSKFAANQLYLKNTPFDKSIEQAVKLQHLTGGGTDKESTQKNLDLLSKISFLMPGGIDKILQAQTYAQGTLGNLLHVNTEESMMFFAGLQRMGIQGTRAGSQLLSAINRSMGKNIMWSGLMPGNNMTGKQLENIGLTKNNVPQFFNNNGQFSTEKWFSIIGDFIKREYQKKPPAVAAGEITTALIQTLGITGERIAGAVGTESGRKEFEEMVQSFKQMPALAQQFQQLQTLLNFQVARGLNNVKSLFAELGYSLLPSATDALGYLDDKLHDLTVFIRAHQETFAFFEKAILGIAGLSIVGGVLIVIRAGLMGLIIPFQILSTITGIALAPILGIGAAIGVVAFGAYEAYEELKSINFKELIEEFKYIGNAIKFTFIDIFTRLFNWVKSKLGFLSPITTTGGKDSNSYINRVENQYKKLSHTPLNNAVGTLAPSLKPVMFIHNAVMAASKEAIRYVFPSSKNAHLANSAHGLTNKIQQPIHVHVNLDGKRMATSVINHIVSHATGVPNSSSQFDSDLSPMPTVLNALGNGS